MIVNKIAYSPFIYERAAGIQKYPQIQTPADIISFSSKNLLLLSSEEISKRIIRAMTKENCIGSGREGSVYKIPESDFCVKVLKKYPFNMRIFGTWEIKNDKAAKVNHILAEAENGATIMKHIHGTPIFKYPAPKELADLPDSSYIDLFRQISEAENIGLNFDIAPANVIFNAETKSLTAIDFYKNDTAEYGYPITRAFASMEQTNTNFGNIKINKKLAGRFLNIVLDKYAERKPPEFTFRDEDVSRFISRIKRTYKQTLPPQFNFLEKSIYEIAELKKAERRGENVDRELTGRIKYAKCIVNQILLQNI